MPQPLHHVSGLYQCQQNTLRTELLPTWAGRRESSGTFVNDAVVSTALTTRIPNHSVHASLYAAVRGVTSMYVLALETWMLQG